MASLLSRLKHGHKVTCQSAQSQSLWYVQQALYSGTKGRVVLLKQDYLAFITDENGVLPAGGTSV